MTVSRSSRELPRIFLLAGLVLSGCAGDDTDEPAPIEDTRPSPHDSYPDLGDTFHPETADLDTGTADDTGEDDDVTEDADAIDDSADTLFDAVEETDATQTDAPDDAGFGFE